MIDPGWLLWGVLAPVAAAALGAAIGAGLRGRAATAAAVCAGAAAAVVLGVHAGGGVPGFPPAEAAGWLPWAALPAGVAASLLEAGGAGRPRRFGWGVRAVGALGLPVLVSASRLPGLADPGPFPELSSVWSVPVAAGALGAALAGLLVAWGASALLLRRRPDGATGLLGVGLLLATGAALGMSGTQRLGQWGVSWAVGLSAAWIVAAAFRRGSVAGPVLLELSVPLAGGLALVGVFFASLSPWQAGLLALVPVAAWLGEAPGRLRGRPGWRAALRVTAGAMPAAIAVAWAAIVFVREMRESELL